MQIHPVLFPDVSIWKRGSVISPLRHIGHFPGRVSLSLFLNSNPHFLQCAGVTERYRSRVFEVFRICSRWSQMSFSGTMISFDNSFAESGILPTSAMIFCRIVSVLSTGGEGFLCSFLPRFPGFMHPSPVLIRHRLMHSPDEVAEEKRIE